MNREYVILNIEKEYPGYTGREKWMIITNLSEEIFKERYPEQIECWNKAVIMNVVMGMELLRYRNNEIKHAWRARKKETQLDEYALDIQDEKVNLKFSNLWLVEALDSLTQQQKERVIKHYVIGLTLKMISSQEGVTDTAVHKSLNRAIANLRKYAESGQPETEGIRND